ncbi:MAG: hypothetical protein H6563_12735 [Lewinellaceae bacterium]|nr:hypothetical protein [Lewinellaceae bacterium]
MKKGNIKAALVAVLVAFTFLIVGVNSGQAQTGLSDDFYTVPAGNYVSAANAEILLADQETLLINFLQTLTPGSQQYKTTMRAVMFYKNIRGGVIEGKQIPESILAGMNLFTTASFGRYTKTEKYGLKQDAIDLLSY